MVTLLEEATKLAPTDAGLLRDLGRALSDLDLHKFALLHLDRAVGLAPSDASVHHQRGLVFARLGDLGAAIGDLRRAVALAPSLSTVHADLGGVLSLAGECDEALRCADTAIALDPGLVPAHLDRATLRLAAMRFETGWAEYEWRSRGTLAVPPFVSPWPRWQGGRDKRLLVRKEQGPGEQILFGALLPELEGFANPVTVELDGRLLPLFERSMPGLRFIDKDGPIDESAYDEEMPIGTLGGLLRPDVAAFVRTRRGFLVPDSGRARELRARLHASGRRVCGIGWRSLNHKLGIHKSIELERMLAVLRTPGFDFVDLQYGDTSAERERLESVHGVRLNRVADVDNHDDLDGLAALIAACDVVVTTSNTGAHLAGALGKDTLLLAPRGLHPLWWWTPVGGRSLWYPSVRVLQQETAGDWSECVAQARAHLESWPCTTN